MREQPEPGTELSPHDASNSRISWIMREQPEPGTELSPLTIPPPVILPGAGPLAQAWMRECAASLLANPLQMLCLALRKACLTAPQPAPQGDGDAPSE